MNFDRLIPRGRRFVSGLLATTVLVCTIGSAQEGDTDTDAAKVTNARNIEFFEKEIVPILKRRCYECHSHKSGIAKGGLVLDSRRGWKKGGVSGLPLFPANPMRVC